MADDTQNSPTFRIKQEPPPATVKVASDETALGYVIINEPDFDPKLHKKWKPKETKPDPSAT